MLSCLTIPSMGNVVPKQALMNGTIPNTEGKRLLHHKLMHRALVSLHESSKQEKTLQCCSPYSNSMSKHHEFEPRITIS